METHSMVALRIFSGNSSAPTSPPTASASPPAALISSTTVWALASSRLEYNINLRSNATRQRQTYSLTTTFAPSFAKRRAQLRPMPCHLHQLVYPRDSPRMLTDLTRACLNPLVRTT